MAIIAALLAGLGLFFFGMYILTDHLKKLSGKSLREKIAQWTHTPFQGLMWGGVIIAITQSTAAATFILIGMMKSGMMTVRKSIPMIIGFNMFGGLIIFVLVLDIKTFILFVLGVAALLYTNDRAYRFKNISGAVLGMGILFLGLLTMQNGVSPLSSEPWFKETIEFAHGSFMLAFIIGAGLTLLIQSSLAVIVFGIAFERAGLLSMWEVTMIVYGSNVGASILTYFLSNNLKGNSRQLAMFQVGYNISGAFLMVPLFYMEYYLEIPLALAFSQSLASDGGTQIAILNLLFNFLPGVILFFAVPAIVALLKKKWPETIEEQISKPKYIDEHILDDPINAIELIQMEQSRLLEIISKSLNSIRENKKMMERKIFHDAFETLSITIRETTSELSSKAVLSPDEYSQVNVIMNNQHLLENINISLESLGEELQLIHMKKNGEHFSKVVVEGLDTILLTLLDAVKEKSLDDFEFIGMMTSPESNGISKIRSAYLNEETDLDNEGKMLLLSTTNLTERIIHNFHEMGQNYTKLMIDDKREEKSL